MASIVEVVTEHRWGRVLSLLESSVVIAGGLVLLNRAGLLPEIPGGYSATATTLLGGVILGIGAFCNRSCAIGTIARIGSGQWAYLATPVGYFIGSLAMSHLAPPMRLDVGSAPLTASWITILLAVVVALRLLTHGWRIWKTGSGPLAYIWSPHVATTIAALAFLTVFLTVGSWTYTTELGALARGQSLDAQRQLLLFGALLTGAVAGGWTVGLRPRMPRAPRVLRCLLGGALMGVGAALIPGGTDGLVLVGMPLLYPYAWLAFSTMCITIYLAVRLSVPKAS